jgi:hypothetical protein
MLDKPASVEAFTAVLHHLSRYRGIVQDPNQVADHSDQALDASKGGNLLFHGLTIEVEQIIFDDYLCERYPLKGIQDQLNLGGSCREGAKTIVRLLDNAAQKQFRGNKNQLDILMANFQDCLQTVEGRLETGLCGLAISQAATADPERYLRPECKHWALKGLHMSNTFSKSFKALRQIFCAQLQARHCLQLQRNNDWAFILPHEVLILRTCEHLYF